MTSNVRFYVQPTLKTLLQVVTKEQMANTQQFEKCLNSLQSQPIVNGNNNRQKPDIEFHTKWHIYNTIDVQCIQFWNAHAQWTLSWPAWPHRVNKTTYYCKLSVVLSDKSKHRDIAWMQLFSVFVNSKHRCTHWIWINKPHVSYYEI